MVAVGVSCTLPEAFELVVRLRVEVPAVAVMVTEVALEDCQLSVTDCPELMEVELAVSVTLGVDGNVVLGLLAQEERPQAASSKIPQEGEQRFFRLMCLCPGPVERDTAREIRCRTGHCCCRRCWPLARLSCRSRRTRGLRGGRAWQESGYLLVKKTACRGE